MENEKKLILEHNQKLEIATDALKDILSGWKYIRQIHGDLSGVGWDRAQQKAEMALSILTRE